MEFKVGDIVKFRNCKKCRGMDIVGYKGKIISISKCGNSSYPECVECGHKYKTINWFDKIIDQKFGKGHNCFGYGKDYIIEKANASSLKEFIENGSRL